MRPPERAQRAPAERAERPAATAPGVARGLASVRFVEMMCGADCEIRCAADERIMNVMPMTATEHFAFELREHNLGLYEGPDKGLTKLMVVCIAQ